MKAETTKTSENTAPTEADMPAQNLAPQNAGAPMASPLTPPKKRKWKKWIKWGVILLAVVVLVVFVLSKCSGKAGGVPASYIPATAAYQDMVVEVTATGTIRPADSYQVTNLISGEITSAPFEEGDTVNKGDLLFAFDGERAQISMEQAQLGYSSLKDSMRPTAPIGGTVTETHVKNGDEVSSGQELMKILNDGDVVIDFLFPEAAAKTISVGAGATVFFTDVEGSTAGSVVSVSGDSFTTSNGKYMRTVQVRVANPGVLNDNLTASAVVGGNSSYGGSSVNYQGVRTVYAQASGTVSGFSYLPGDKIASGSAVCSINSDSLETQLKNQALSIKSAGNSMDDYKIESPISGTVVAKNYKAGDQVQTGSSAGNILAEIYDLSYLKLVLAIDELDINKVEIGQEVTVTADAVQGESFTGTVDRIGINGSTANGVTTYPVTIIVTDYGALKPGMNVSASIIVERADHVLTIPVGAVSQGNMVTVPGPGAMDAQGIGVIDSTKLEQRQVELGRNNGDVIEVTGGVEEGETVLVANQASNAMAMMGGY